MLTLIADIVRRTRQHHAIEHATIHMLAARYPRQSVSGYSDPLGFTIYGEVSEENLRHAVGDALLRLQAGESELAIHPNCGTNLLVSGVMVTSVALLAGSLRRNAFERFIVALSLALVALIGAKPLGYRLQVYTTSADVADRWVAQIRPVAVGGVQAFRVLFD